MSELGLEPRFLESSFTLPSTASCSLSLLTILGLESRYLGMKYHLFSIWQIFQGLVGIRDHARCSKHKGKKTEPPSSWSVCPGGKLTHGRVSGQAPKLARRFPTWRR